MASVSSPFTSAPITPKLVTLRFSKGLYVFEVFKNGYKNNGMWALRNLLLVSGCNAKHYNNPKTLQTLEERAYERLLGVS